MARSLANQPGVRLEATCKEDLRSHPQRLSLLLKKIKFKNLTPFSGRQPPGLELLKLGSQTSHGVSGPVGVLWAGLSTAAGSLGTVQMAFYGDKDKGREHRFFGRSRKRD